MLSYNEIVRCFDHQYIWKESVDILDSFYGDTHYRKVVTETITFGWLWPDVPSHTQACLDLVGCH